ncbi:MAG TPA: hypothetical protein VNI02_13220 [Blastocatellia bacterium]|nr:hypothetical protein [Blastocatellia bacterium]
MVSPLHAQFYQQLITTPVGFRELGTRLVRHAEHAYTFRKVERVEEAARLLVNLPIKQYQLIGQYYLGWCEYVRGADVKNTFEHIAEHATLHYRARAMHTLATLAAREKDSASELGWITESMKASPLLEGFRGMAIMKAREGFHGSSIKDLESYLPLARYADPLSYYDYLNSFAVELGEAGRINEARNVSRVVLASPLAFAYPEWKETAQELKEPNRAFIPVPQIEREPVEVQSIQSHHASKEARPHRPRRLIPFPPLREVPKPSRPNRVTPEEFGDMTADERAELVLATIRSGAVRESDYVKLVIALGLLDSGPISKVIDLEDEAVLDDIVSVWCNMIEPEEFASVMSAIRDCKDDLRRANIIDNMIEIAFKQTHASMQTEQEWRLRVERKLPDK